MEIAQKYLSIWTRLLVGAVLAVSIPSAVGAATFTVDRIDDDPALFICEQNTAFDCTLRGAIIAANLSPGPDTVVVPSSTYELTVVGTFEDAAVSGDLDLLGEVVIEGAEPLPSIVDAGGTTGIGDRVFHVHPGANVTFSKITIQGGNLGTFECDIGCGGGISTSGLTTLLDSTIQGNNALQGGGVRNDGTMTIRRSMIIDNGVGGSSTEFGGGISNTGALDISHTIISGNRAAFDLSSGGGLHQDFASAVTTIWNSEITDNYALSVGGGVFNKVGTLTLKYSTVSGNTTESPGKGAGVWNASTAEIINSTLSGNDFELPGLGEGGNIYNETGGSLDLLHATLADSFSFGGVALSNRGSAFVANTILQSGNTSAPCAGDPVTSLGGNIESTDSAGGNNLADSCGLDQPGDQVEVELAELNLSPLADNGGPTQTRALLPGSFAIDSGISSECAFLDQRGWGRVDGSCDVGAFEVGADPNLIFLDGFESGDTSAWSSS